jgi:acyl-CoA reductase-like NAD-dependent aldehyde dehydrogenase
MATKVRRYWRNFIGGAWVDGADGVQTPFSGMKRSGYGREMGQEALLGYVQTKNVGIRL